MMNDLYGLSSARSLAMHTSSGRMEMYLSWCKLSYAAVKHPLPIG